MSSENQKKLWEHYYNTLSKGVDVGYNPKPEMYDPALSHSLKYNIAEFSAFKETSFRKQLEAALTSDGKVTPWSEFKKKADELNVEYNRRWLKTEYDHTVATANMAQQWQDFEADADLYPNLRYNAVGDARTREQHKAWDGLILPIKHEFWKTHLPPNDWGCRCNVEQTDDASTVEPPEIATKGAFNNNAALSGKVFKENAYEKGLSSAEVKEAKSNLSDFLQSEKNLINTKNPKVKISLGADLQDLRRNYQVANICAKELDIDILIRTHNMNIGIKNPEYLIANKYLGDRKSIESLNGMLKGIDTAKKQMMQSVLNPNQVPHYIIWDLDLINKIDIDLLIKNLLKKVTVERGRTIKGMIFQHKGKVAHITREQIIKLDFDSLNVLK